MVVCALFPDIPDDVLLALVPVVCEVVQQSTYQLPPPPHQPPHPVASQKVPAMEPVARVDPDPKHTLVEEESSGSTSKLSRDLETKLKVCQITIRNLKDSYKTKHFCCSFDLSYMLLC